MSESPENMKFEQARLTTFQTWPSNAKVEAWKMAKAGLFHTGQDEEVGCTWCDCVLSNWQYGDQVMAKHRLASPDCPFIQNQSDNVPLLPGESTTPTTTRTTTSSSPNNSSNTNNTGEDVDNVGVLMETDHSPHEPGRTPSTPPDPSAELKSEVARLSTFTNWPLSFMNPPDLARAGFYYLGRGDSCRCAFCGSYVGDWVEGDEPMAEHRNLFPMCPFVRGIEVGNVPVRTVPNGGTGAVLSPLQEVSTPVSPGHDVTGPRWPTWHRSPNAGPEKGNGIPNFFSKVGQGSAKENENIGIIKHNGPLHPNYATMEARLRTFREWPPGLRQQPRELAEAGFYYIGMSDQVKCFYCDGGLRNWQPEDVPWVEHSRWFSRCVFVRLVKGDEFVAKSLLDRPPESRTGVPVLKTTHDKPMRTVTEDDVRSFMSQAVVHQVLSMGIDASRVKMAIKRRLETTGSGFESAEHLINAAFSVQREQEYRNEAENNPNSSAFQRTAEESRENQQTYDEVTERMEVPAPLVSPSISSSDEIQSQSGRISATQPAQPMTPPPDPAAGPQSLPTTPATTTPQTTPLSSYNSLPLPTTPPPASLEDENARLKEQRTCKICMDGEVGVVFLPCGHFCACVNCAPALKDCPVCRTPIQGTVRTYMS